ncbi:hypothetical protein T265_11193 [Opisthorchis viverrini]|uniref:Uncharacterized protein n=1 Tax=Opisthorchis viverrini TaxID=6198 RepID=A0A074ZAF8_OPIVI|nr:hypothetical protein T265_11193 [Opisthorchis viverrini]KER20195.1 hypothetical protein T265_11193 [Opisthorchis viverrini]
MKPGVLGLTNKPVGRYCVSGPAAIRPDGYVHFGDMSRARTPVVMRGLCQNAQLISALFYVSDTKCASIWRLSINNGVNQLRPGSLSPQSSACRALELTVAHGKARLARDELPYIGNPV